MTEKLIRIETELEQARSSISNLGAELNAKLEQLDRLQEEKISAEFQIREAEGRVVEKVALIQDLEHLRQQDIAGGAEIKSRVESLNSQLQMTECKITELEGLIIDLTQAKKELTEKAKTLESEVNIKSSRYAELECKYNQLENRYRQQEVEVPGPEVNLFKQ